MAQREDLDISLFNIDPEVAKAFLTIMVTGECPSHRNYYKNHRMIPDARIVLLDIHLPLDRSKKGTVKLVPSDSTKYEEPSLSNEIKRYGKKEYLGHNMYLHPSHQLSTENVKLGKQDKDINERVGVIILKNRGCFTFVPK